MRGGSTGSPIASTQRLANDDGTLSKTGFVAAPHPNPLPAKGAGRGDKKELTACEFWSRTTMA